MSYSTFLGYDKGEDGTLVINEEQAVIIRRIYKLYLEGLSTHTIAKILTEQGIKTPKGKMTADYRSITLKTVTLQL